MLNLCAVIVGITHMLFEISSDKLTYVLSLTLILSFFLAYSVDMIMGKHGFGIWGNMIIINVQFQMGFWLIKHKTTAALTTNELLIGSLAFTFGTILVMAFSKVLLQRI